jgi:hypothetical protein
MKELTKAEEAKWKKCIKRCSCAKWCLTAHLVFNELANELPDVARTRALQLLRSQACMSQAEWLDTDLEPELAAMRAIMNFARQEST